MNLFRRRDAGADRGGDGQRLDLALGGQPLAVRLKVDARARRVSLRLDAARREVVAVAPSPARLKDAAAFAAERADWIAQRLAELPRPAPLAPGTRLTVLGRPCRLEAAPGRARLVFEAADGAADGPGSDGAYRLTAPAEGAAPDAYRRAALRLLKAEARRVLAERTAVHAAALNQPTPAVSIMDARARWGSCRPARRAGFGAAAEVGRIRYSWRLILAPPAVLDYVAAHECAHLIEANHGPAFWALVRRLAGDPRPHRDWLRAHGSGLHGVGA